MKLHHDHKKCRRTFCPLLLVLIALSLQACTIFNPYLAQPEWSGNYDDAINAMRTTTRSLKSDVASQNTISSLSGLGTFLGVGGAGIAAMFRGSSDLILGFATGGAASFAVNGLYGNRNQTAIYNNGLDAMACIQDAVAPITSAHIRLTAAELAINTDLPAVLADMPAATVPPGQQARAQTAVANARATLALATKRHAEEDAISGSIVSATRAVVATINKQLQSVVPDASALSRAASGIATASLNGQSSAEANRGTPTNPARSTSPSTPKLQMFLAGETIDEKLEGDMNLLITATNDAIAVLAADIKAPVISCKVADAPTMPPLAIGLPAGTTGIEVHPGSSLTYPITGGTQPYAKIAWIGAAPAYLDVYIESPNILHVAAKPGATLPDSATLSFDIYDSLGQHLAAPVTITVKKS